MAEKKGSKYADLLFGKPEEEKAAFGVFPQMKPRRSKQDREAAKNVPVDLARGFVSGVLGAPGDIESLIRMLPGLDEKTVLPTSEDIEKRIPLRSDTPVSRAATGLGQLGGGFYVGPGSPLRAIGALPGAVKKAGREFAEASSPLYVVKPSGAAAKAKTPYERSLEQGYEHGWYHGTTGDIRSFDPKLRGETTGARSAQKGFFFVRDPQNPPEKMLVKSSDPQSVELMRKLGYTDEQIAQQNKVSFEGHGAETASGYASLGGSRTYKEAMRKANAAERRGDWPEYEKQISIAEDAEIGLSQELQSLVAKYGDVRDEMLDKIQKAVYDRQLPQAEAEALDQWYKSVMPYGWYNTFGTDKFFDNLSKELVNKIGEERAAPALEAMKQFLSVRNERALMEKTQEGSNVMPVALRYKKPYVYDYEGSSYRDESYSDLIDKALAGGHDALILKNTYDPGAGPAKLVDIGVVFDPAQVRSRFAKFNPEDIQSSDITKAKGGAVMAAATIDGGEFVRVAEKYGLGSDNATLNKIVRLVNQGMSLDKAAQSVASSGKVSFSDNPDTMRLELAGGGAVGMQDGGAAFGQYTTGRKYQKARERAQESGAAEVVEGALRGLFGLDPAEGAGSRGMEAYRNMAAASSSPTPLALAALPAGVVKGVKGLSKAEKAAAVPLDIPRVRPTKQDIIEAAERVGRQQLGEHVTNPLTGKTENLAGRSIKEAKRLKELEYEVKPIKELPKSQPYEAKVGEVNIALPGDQTIADMILESVEGVPIGSVQEGGAKFGLGRMTDPEEFRAFWASNAGPARAFQNKVLEIAQKFDTDLVTAYHLAMGTTSNNFAQHFADANIRAIDYSKLSKKDMNTFDKIIAEEARNPKTGEKMPFPDWPGIANPVEALEAMKKNPELRKWFNDRMKTQKVTKATNMPDGRAIEWAITEPEIRNMEINLTGLSAGRMKPGAEIIPDSRHQTYSHDIPGTALGRAPELAPFSISFPDVTAFVREQYRPQDFTGTIQKVFPHQIVDEAYLEDMQKYYEQLRKVRGFQKGGEVKKAAGGNIDKLTSRQMLYLSSSPDIAKLTPEQQREAVANMGADELRQRMQGYFAKGGAIKKTKVSDNPDTMRLELMKAKG